MPHPRLRVIKHVLTVEYQCPDCNIKHTVKINDPRIYHGQYFDDWSYEYMYIRCQTCGKENKYEV